jgi:CBS domain-containing protein
MAKIKEIMRRYVVTVDTKASLVDAAKIMANNRIGSVIVMEKGALKGIVTADDVTAAVARGSGLKKTKVLDVASKKLITAGPEDDILKVVRVMVKSGIKRVPVVKEGQLVGIVSDKEIMVAAPEMVDVLSERLKARISMATYSEESTSGICEDCEAYSDDLQNIGGKWLCEGCRESE